MTIWLGFLNIGRQWRWLLAIHKYLKLLKSLTIWSMLYSLIFPCDILSMISFFTLQYEELLRLHTPLVSFWRFYRWVHDQLKIVSIITVFNGYQIFFRAFFVSDIVDFNFFITGLFNKKVRQLKKSLKRVSVSIREIFLCCDQTFWPVCNFHSLWVCRVCIACERQLSYSDNKFY